MWRTVFLVALGTGMRQGELTALTWGDVDLTGKLIEVGASYTNRRLTGTKSGEPRTVDVTDDVVELLGAWWGECGNPGDDKLVFPNERDGGYLSASAFTKYALYPAMTRAKIPRVGKGQKTKRTFHSMRHTYARRCLENGLQMFWLSEQLGHADERITSKVYGHWSRAASKAQVAKLEGLLPRPRPVPQ